MNDIKDTYYNTCVHQEGTVGIFIIQSLSVSRDMNSPYTGNPSK